jgi:hypothetical protein
MVLPSSCTNALNVARSRAVGLYQCTSRTLDLLDGNLAHFANEPLRRLQLPVVAGDGMRVVRFPAGFLSSVIAAIS